MNCRDVRRYINLFIDSELDSKTNLEISEHLSSCEDCSKRFAQEERIEKSLVSALKGEKDLKAEEVWESAISRFGHHIESQGERRLVCWILKKCVAPATALIIAITLIMHSKQETNELTVAVQKCHMEYMTNKIVPTIESVSTDEVAEYFSGKFTFPVSISQIPDIKSHHVKLFGGKVCHLNGISTAYIMYHCCNTPISVFILSTKDAGSFSDIKHCLEGNKIFFKKTNGINLVATSTNQDTFVCVVADHDEDVLRWMANNFTKT